MSPAAAVREVGTPHGVARVHVWAAGGAGSPAAAEASGIEGGVGRGAARGGVAPCGGLVLGHGAGGGVGARDLVAVASAATAAGVVVVLVEQPYRVAGRRAPAPARQLDAAWAAVLEDLRGRELAGLAVVVGGRSSGARVACRTAAETGAAGVLCLAFPLQPPARAGRPPSASRLPELEAVAIPVLIVQGRRDRFGMPPAAPQREVLEVEGDHALRAALPLDTITSWLTARLDKDGD